MYLFSEIGRDIILSIFGLGFMVLSSLLLIIATKKALNSTNKMAFIQITMVNVFLKIAGLLTIVVVYFKIFKPESKIIIIPFLLIYLVFSVFETLFTYKIAKENS